MKTKNDLNAFTRRLRSVLRTRDAKRALDHVDFKPGHPWTRGGCFVLAVALEQYFGPRATAVGIRSTRSRPGCGHEHAVVKIGDLYLDYEGAHTASGVTTLYEESAIDTRLSDSIRGDRFLCPGDGVAHLLSVLQKTLGPPDRWGREIP